MMRDYEDGSDDLPIIFLRASKYPNGGIDGALFMLWAANRSLVNDEYSHEILHTYSNLVGVNFAEILGALESVTGSDICPSAFNSEGRSFALKYLQPGWKHFFLTDVRQCFSDPEVEDFSMVPETSKTLTVVWELIERRFVEFKS